ncbi:predicted protein [Chaetomium globosum CBS 148.51]|uniref:Uncharacterized protein n=1 Tax=Chaetomium globosum (strain ATCC 6205 / CBS 148.51 / DSM 1962 / NBRC 6347 / NRRL 1970) TaxID=306901 RepID=Q2HDK6_CHAGB|nr:uncharacterized protein CHGG_01698 [Chaetomium globosum CBS 148.51]EAQ93463.1 predicted protein [Chaetomium globosum CBS 148.51]
MGGGNGAKAAQKRARNDKKAGTKAVSQLKSVSSPWYPKYDASTTEEDLTRTFLNRTLLR